MENSKTTYSIIIGIIVVILIGLGIYSFMKKPVTTDNVQNNEQSTTGDNRLIVEDQFPGKSVYVSSVTLAQSGFVAIYSNNAGVPGKFLGSQMFQKGTQPGTISLTENLLNGSTYMAVLFIDNGDGKFTSADGQAKDRNGNMIMSTFKASDKIPEMKG